METACMMEGASTVGTLIVRWVTDRSAVTAPRFVRTVKTPESGVADCGAYSTLMVQLPLIANVAGQLLVAKKLSTAEIEIRFKGAPLILVTVTVCASPVVSSG